MEKNNNLGFYVFILAVVLFVCLSLSACAKNNGVSRGGESESDMPVPQMVSLATGELLEDYEYIIDTNTGVVYLKYQQFNRYGITVMLNPDGTPITAEQLKTNTNPGLITSPLS